MLKKTKLNNPNIQTNSIVLMYHLIYLASHNISIFARQNQNQPLIPNQYCSYYNGKCILKTEQNNDDNN